MVGGFPTQTLNLDKTSAPFTLSPRGGTTQGDRKAHCKQGSHFTSLLLPPTKQLQSVTLKGPGTAVHVLYKAMAGRESRRAQKQEKLRRSVTDFWVRGE